MDEIQQKFLDTLPSDASRSRLEPYRELILQLRRSRRSYNRIRAILATNFQTEISKTALVEFVHRRARPRVDSKNRDVSQSPRFPETDQSLRKPIAVEQSLPFCYLPEELAAMREAARASNHKPTVPVNQDNRPVFHYDPDRPLSNRPNQTRED